MASQIIGLTNESAYAGDVIHLVKGMNKTYSARFVIERYQAGVDLNTLVWSVNMRAANNALYYEPVTVSEYDDNAIYIDWVITHAATLARGTTFYTVEGKTAGDEAPVWRSTIHSINVSEAVDAGEIYEGADEDAVEQLILELRADMNTALGNTVHYNAADNKTDAEKVQARENIGATSEDEMVEVKTVVNDSSDIVFFKDYGEGMIPTNPAYTQYIDPQIYEFDATYFRKNTFTCTVVSNISGARTVGFYTRDSSGFTPVNMAGKVARITLDLSKAVDTHIQIVVAGVSNDGTAYKTWSITYDDFNLGVLTFDEAQLVKKTGYSNLFVSGFYFTTQSTRVAGEVYRFTVEVADADDVADGWDISSRINAKMAKITSEDTYNIWPTENTFTFTQNRNITGLNIPIGDYVLSAKITSSDVDATTCLVAIRSADKPDGAVASTQMSRGSYVYWSFHLDYNCNEVRFFASKDSGNSSGDTATFENVMLVRGTEERLFAPPVSPVDYVARDIAERLGHNDTKIAFFGDSIVYSALKTVSNSGTSFVISQANPSLPGVISTELHCTVDNYGVSGAGYKVAPSGGMNIYDYMQTIDLSTYTHVMILAGDNDSSVGETGIGTYQDTTGDTVMGQIYLIMTYLHEEYPQIIPVICHKNNKIALKTSPAATQTVFGSFLDYYYGYTYGGTDGFSIAKLHEEIDKFCEHYHVCKIDYKDFCMGGWQLQEMVGPDMTHFSQHGYNVLGKYLAGQMQRLIG